MPLNQKNQTQMKNLFAIVALVGIFSLALASCGGKKDEKKADSTKKDTVAKEEAPVQAEEMPDSTEAPAKEDAAK